ncbi:SMI1/KNR4 family protein [Paenibacillus methanolicus]|uniref:SUKH superfamily protein n=1 Tax=Paenibacillus methanolicus TaxID=582686 RepID=A0A5S5C5S0_9BACL|nr:SMI1/KNR4 family protein [Paenibacillus methanolicus]TYP74775.1 SUKH superfamily protein [Paenibacillus methanolicus]
MKLADRRHYVKLRDCSELEAMFFEQLLQAEGIPYFRREPGAGGYMRVFMGSAPFPIELHVPGDRYEEADELIAALTADADWREELADPVEDAEAEEEGRVQARRGPRYWRRGIAALFLLVLVAMNPFSEYEGLDKLVGVSMRPESAVSLATMPYFELIDGPMHSTLLTPDETGTPPEEEELPPPPPEHKIAGEPGEFPYPPAFLRLLESGSQPESVMQVVLPDGEGTLLLSGFLNFDQASEDYLPAKHRVFVESRGFPDKLVPFAWDPFGEYYFFDYREETDDSPPIVQVVEEWEEGVYADGMAIIGVTTMPIAASFEDFMSSLTEMTDE